MLKPLNAAAGGAARFPRLPLCSSQPHASRRRPGAVSAAHLRRLAPPASFRGLHLADRPEAARTPAHLPPSRAQSLQAPPYPPGQRRRCSSPGREAATKPPRPHRSQTGPVPAHAQLLLRAASAGSGISCASAQRLRDGCRESCLY